MKIVSAYAPTAGKKAIPTEEERLAKRHFYSQLEAIIDKEKHRSVLVIGGDFNARVGTKDEAWSTEIGMFGLPDRNEPGDKI